MHCLSYVFKLKSIKQTSNQNQEYCTPILLLNYHNVYYIMINQYHTHACVQDVLGISVRGAGAVGAVALTSRYRGQAEYPRRGV